MDIAQYRQSPTTIIKEFVLNSKNLEEAIQVDDILSALGHAMAFISRVLDNPTLLYEKFNFENFVDIVGGKLEECQKKIDEEKTEDQDIEINFFKELLQAKKESEKMKEAVFLQRILFL